MLEMLKHRLNRDNDECGCARREPGGLKYHSTGWYCTLCHQRLTMTEAKLNGYENPMISKEMLIPDNGWKDSSITAAPTPGYSVGSTYLSASTRRR